MEIMSPKKTKTTTTTTLYVPNDIIIDILSWVPANSLLRLRWSCKYWFHLITRDTSFARLHLHTATNQDFSVLISKSLNPFDYILSASCKIFQCYIDHSTTTSGSFSTNNPILSGTFVDFRILGSCHGLILFSYYLQERKETILCIWNPCTKEYKYLPKPPYWIDGYKVSNAYFGLGYDHSIEDYKVICNAKSLDANIHVHVQVYTLRTNAWKYIGSITTNTIEDKFYGFIGNGVFVNGALHFIYHKEGAYDRILSLDLEKEMYFERWNQPECLNDKAKSIEGLTMFEGSLCLKMRTGYRISEAWVMKKDYNMNNNQEEYSWSKLYEISYMYDTIMNHLLQPLRFTKDGEIMLLDFRKYGAKDLCWFDPNKLTIHEVYKFHPIQQAAITVDINNKIEVIYMESLVSLNSGTYIDEKGDYMHYWQE